MVVIVHGNQEPAALATVTWDNAFAQWGRAPFVVPDKVTWAQAGDALNMKWKAACGRDLSEENLYYLACKAFRLANQYLFPYAKIDIKIKIVVASWLIKNLR